MANYVEVANLEQLPPGKGTVVTIEGKDVALFNVDGKVCAMADGCLHHGVSLGTSQLDGKIVTCRGHGWKYDVTTGSTLNVPGYGVAAYPARIVDGKILVAIDEPLEPRLEKYAGALLPGLVGGWAKERTWKTTSGEYVRSSLDACMGRWHFGWSSSL